MFERIHEAFVERSLTMWGITLIVAQLFFALLTLLFADLGERWPIVVYQLVGSAAIYVGIRRNEAGHADGMFLLMLGAVASLIFLYTFLPPLGYLALVTWGIVLLVSIVT